MLLALILYAGYHAGLWRRLRRDPMSTTIGHNYEARRQWCEAVMAEGGGREILAVQTLRNTMMSSSLLASTSLTLSAVVAAYLVNAIKVEGLVGLDIFSSPYLHPVHKFFAVIFFFTIAFYCYLQSVRASNHASYLISIPSAGSSLYTPSYACRVVQAGVAFHTAGTRVFYLALLSVIWMFGPLPLLALTLALLLSLRSQDRATPLCLSSPDPAADRTADPAADCSTKHRTSASPVECTSKDNILSV